ncbi:hypothetical protein GQ53DRAFT_766271 [Thozetella sp. PMI_491]|nr:hypothetical protein GQ53DRAFT_766271 [Thozetella sp. PMI_491]
MGPGPRQPILLYGFDWDTQKEQDFAATVWGAVFLRRKYTDEDEESYRHQPPSKQLEVKYGNNVATLFMAMVRFAPYRQKAGFWEAIGLGFGAGKEYLIEAVDILVRARRISRYRRAKHTAELLDVADEWIDIVDGRLPGPTYDPTLANPDRLKARAREFYDDMEHRPLLNMARIPYTLASRKNPLPLSITGRPQRPGTPSTSDSSMPGAGAVQGIDPTRISRLEDSSPTGNSLASRITRKRSLSPLPGIRSEHPSKRLQLNAATPDRDVLANIKASPPSPPTGPRGMADPTWPSPRRTSSLGEKQHGASPLPPPRRHSDQGASSSADATAQRVHETKPPSAPSGVVTDELHRTKLPTNGVDSDSTGGVKQLAETNRLLGLLLSKLDGKASQAGGTSAPRDNTNGQRIADELQDIKEDVNALLRTLSAVSESHATLIDGVAHIGEKMPMLVSRPDGSSSSAVEHQPATQDRDDLRQQQKELFDGLLKQQSEQFEQFGARTRALMRDSEGGMQRHLEQLVQDAVNRSVERPLSELKEHLTAQVAVALEKPEPKTWGMQLAMLEEDTKRHLYRIDKFYRKPGSQSLPHVDANFIPDLMMAMQDIIRRAQAGQNN